VETTDTQILSEAVFEKLFKEHFKSMCFFAQRYVKDFEAAREIVQEVFVILWEKRSTIDVSRPARAYLGTSVYNRCLNFLRDNRKFNKDILIAEHLFPESAAEFSDFLVVEEINKKIDEAIAELPEKCREVFVLNRFEHLKYQQIAEKLQISVKTVEAQMSKALSHMRLRLAEYILVMILLMFFIEK